MSVIFLDKAKTSIGYTAILKADPVEFYKIFLCVDGALRDELGKHAANRLTGQ